MTTTSDPIQAAAELLAQAIASQQPEPEPETRARPSEFDDLPAMIPVPRVARLLGISRATAYRLAASGQLPSRRFGRRILVMRDRLRDMLEVDAA